MNPPPPESGPEGALLQPWDSHNQRLQGLVHPLDWSQPEPAPRYNLVVLGGGTAGLVAAAGAAGLGARVALVERHLLGGDCLNTGCVPSKALIRAARAAAEARRAREFGVVVPGPVEVDFPAVMERVRRLRADLGPHDSAERFRALGVDVFLGAGCFTAGDQVEVAGRRLRFDRAVIATGARPAAPAIPGLDGVPHLTHQTLFSLTTRPSRLGIIGAGPIGCEMAQCFARFGTEVFLVESAHGILPRDDREAAARVQAALERDGVRVLCCSRDLRLSAASAGVRIQAGSHDRPVDVVVDRLLVAAGRAPNVEGLGLEAAGVAFDRHGVTVDDHLRTTHPRIYACGDICSRYAFTHAADFMARIVIQNALFLGRARASALQVPWCTYTSPELAHVGLSPEEAGNRGIRIRTFTQEMDRVDRAILDGETTGFVRVHVREGTDRVVGATLVAAHAGELISEISLAMKGGLGLRTLASTLHPYPTQADALRRTGDAFNRTRLTPWVQGLLGRWLSWRRR